MAGTIKVTIGKVKNNPIGAVVGAVGAFFAAKKFGKVTNKYALAGIAVAGLVVGAMAQSAIKAKSSAPKASDVK